jgi:hypothetical protein
MAPRHNPALLICWAGERCGLDPRQPPRLPTGLRPDVRAHAKRIIAENPHLWDVSQLTPLLRLATYYADIDQMTAEIDETGFLVEGPTGAAKANPVVAMRDVAARGALALERQLAITFVARGSNAKKHELQGPASPPKAKAKPGERVLRLA